jgi:hypothetical protein
MSKDSQTTEKTEQQLFDEVSEAMASGKSLSFVDDVTLVEPGTTPEGEEPNSDGTAPAEEPEKKEEEAEGTETTPEEGKETPPASPTETPEERVTRLEQERAQLEHRLRSDAGRVAALQRKVDDLLRAQPTPAKETKPAPEASVAKTKFDEKIAKVRELDPDLADVLEALREDVTEKSSDLITNKVSQTEQFIRQREEQEVFAREKARLLEMVPEADDVFRNPAWRQWKESQPANILALASSMDADEMYLAMQKFATDMQRQHPELYTAAPVTTGTPAEPSPAAAKVTNDRARKLAAGTPPSAGTVAKQGKGGPQTDEELFELVSQQLYEGKPIKF